MIEKEERFEGKRVDGRRVIYFRRLWRDGGGASSPSEAEVGVGRHGGGQPVVVVIVVVL